MDIQYDNKVFQKDVDNGLSKPKKELYSKYFYDVEGSRLFNQITRHPDYYLTNCELQILTSIKAELAGVFSKKAFNLIELGPGEGMKSKILIQEFLAQAQHFSYLPIDISESYLKILSDDLHGQYPKLNILPLHGDYFTELQWQKEHSTLPNLVLFLGSSIGNLSTNMAIDFLTHLKAVLKPGDYLLIGFDLIKSKNKLLSAYADSDGLTRAFNLNLLKRINNELGGNFELNNFQHSAFFNEEINAMESFLISKTSHDVYINSLDKTFMFFRHEPIHMEYSFKYTRKSIHDFAKQAGFTVIKDFTDPENNFIDSLWRV